MIESLFNGIRYGVKKGRSVVDGVTLYGTGTSGLFIDREGDLVSEVWPSLLQIECVVTTISLSFIRIT